MATKMMQLKKGHKAQKGFTLVEILVVLGIIAIIGAAVFYFATTGRRGAESDSAIRVVMSIMADAKSLKTSGSYAPNVQDLYIRSGKAPTQIVDAAGTGLVNDWGGTIDLLPASVGTGTDNAIEVSYNTVPKQICVDMASRISSAVLEVVIGTTTVKDASTPVADPEAIVDACEAGADNNTVIMRNS